MWVKLNGHIYIYIYIIQQNANISEEDRIYSSIFSELFHNFISGNSQIYNIHITIKNEIPYEFTDQESYLH